MDSLLNKIKRYIPAKIFSFFQPPYHWSLAFVSALIYRFPSKDIKVIAVTGTKGKSSTVELISAFLEEAGYKTALSNTIRFKIGDESEDNLYKMSMPGRFFVQRFIRKAVNAGCDYLVMEMTSQGSLLHRHRFIDLDAFVFTNLSPEHIESHGSFDKYREAKLDIARTIEHSSKKDTVLVLNADDKEYVHFESVKASRVLEYSLNDAEPYQIRTDGIDLTFSDKKVSSKLAGLFNLYNILAAMRTAESQGVSDEAIASAVERFSSIKGRVEKIEAGQPFNVIVDYAHTPDSLEKLYAAFKHTRNICVLGGTGGGRDSWKRKEMGRIADLHCAEIILTDEDPYDEDPRKIVDDVASGISKKTPLVIMDRRAAIREALKKARHGDSVLITGKGTDPYIMGRNGMKIPWSDAGVAREQLECIARNRKP